MATINLRDLYPEKNNKSGEKIQTPDCFIDVPDTEVEIFVANITDTVADVYFEFQRKETAHERKKRKYRAYYSLDSEEWANKERKNLTANSFEESLISPKIEKQKQALKAAFAILTEKQARRIHEHIILGHTFTSIAKEEGVDESTVRDSIKSGLAKIKKFISVNFLSPSDTYPNGIFICENIASFTFLSEKQAKRIYKHLVLGKGYTAIAKEEGVDESAVRRSVEKGIHQIKNFLTKL